MIKIVIYTDRGQIPFIITESENEKFVERLTIYQDKFLQGKAPRMTVSNDFGATISIVGPIDFIVEKY